MKSLYTIRRLAFLQAGIGLALLAGCAGITSVPAATASIPAPELTATQIRPTATRRPMATSTPFPTVVPTFFSKPDAFGKVSWHPQEVLINWSYSGWSVSDPYLMLLWDGTLVQRGLNIYDLPLISKLDNTEVCKILNTVEKSGFYTIPEYSGFLYDDVGASGFEINTWKSGNQGFQFFNDILSGRGYDDGLFCQDCILPNPHAIMRPSLANLYFLLKDYAPPNRKVMKLDRLYIWTDGADVGDDEGLPWPVKSFVPEALFDYYSSDGEVQLCEETTLVIDGQAAREVMQKVTYGTVYRLEGKKYPFQIYFRPVWPGENPVCDYRVPTPSAPSTTLACSPEDGSYNILPLSEANMYWLYSHDGNWGAELVAKPGMRPEIHLVNKLGFDHSYHYNPVAFGQGDIQVYPRYWSEDNRYLLINVLPTSNQGQEAFYTSVGMQKIDVVTLKSDYIFQGSNGERFNYAISLLGKYIAYISLDASPMELVVTEISTGNKIIVPLEMPNGNPYNSAGTIQWSVEDESNLYLVAVFDENGVEESHILKIDLRNPHQSNIIYSAIGRIKLRVEKHSNRYAKICHLELPWYEECDGNRLDLGTGKVIQ